MKTTRRQFIQTTVTTGVALESSRASQVLAQGLTAGKRGHTEEVNRLISREGKTKGLTKEDLPTPALLLDLDIFEANLKKMAKHASSNGKALRPHAKTHKCVEVARRQLEAGALGVCVATVPEAEMMVAGKVRGVLLTSPITSPNKIERMVRLAAKAADLMVVVDHPRQVELFQAAAAAQGRTLNVVVDLNVGDRRTGVLPGQPALDLALHVSRSKNLKLRGLQAYSGGSSHVVGFENRKAHSLAAMTQAAETRKKLAKEGLPVEIFSGTSTGTYNIDSDLAELTELQVGSYIFMDLDYRRIGGRNGEIYNDFGHSLTVMATVVSANHPDRVTLDAGLKAFSTDRSFGPEAKDVTGVTYRWGGDEFGILTLTSPSREIKLGDRLEFIIPHCDPSVNLYDRLYACRGNRVEAVWSVMGRLRG
ncbi:DSD1 family PLP-dependent enzyme [Acidobacteria bacterium AH-259-G07]|nr:DSD1 family PLP-dependent enzyme [Acidobacteria bacterium AH-259-G07]